MSESFSEYIDAERARLNEQRQAVNDYIVDCQMHIDARKRMLTEIEREFEAINAYEAAKTGKTAKANAAPKATRIRRGSKREGLMAIIAEGVGFTRGDLLDRMGVRGDKAGTMAVSNALTAMKKQNQIRHEGGRYFPAVAEQEPETWPTPEQQAALQEAAE